MWHFAEPIFFCDLRRVAFLLDGPPLRTFLYYSGLRNRILLAAWTQSSVPYKGSYLSLGFIHQILRRVFKHMTRWICVTRDTHYETVDPARLPAQIARRCGQRNWNSVWWGKKYFVRGPDFRAARRNKSLLYRHDKPNEPTKKGPLSFVLFESTFTSISTVSRGHTPL
jgi:hypothetical protein